MQFRVSQKQLLQAQNAVDTSTLNGLIFMAMTLKRRGLLTDSEAEVMHTVMCKPLNAPDAAANPIVQVTQQHLDEQFASIREARPT